MQAIKPNQRQLVGSMQYPVSGSSLSLSLSLTSQPSLFNSLFLYQQIINKNKVNQKQTGCICSNTRSWGRNWNWVGLGSQGGRRRRGNCRCCCCCCCNYLVRRLSPEFVARQCRRPWRVCVVFVFLFFFVCVCVCLFVALYFITHCTCCYYCWLAMLIAIRPQRES